MDVRACQRSLLTLGFAVLLVGCENSATSYEIDGKDHSISIVREQRFVWNDAVEQKVVVARFPDCQRRHRLADDVRAMTAMELYEVRPRLFVLRQGQDWYALGTESCQMQRFERPPQSPGRLVGRFERREGRLDFFTAP